MLFFVASKAITVYSYSVGERIKQKVLKMAKKNKYWDENKVTLIPLMCCAGFLVLLAGVWLGNRKYMDAKYERERAEKIREAKAAADSVKLAKDTIALSAVNQRQK